jgi:hypothetical protein
MTNGNEQLASSTYPTEPGSPDPELEKLPVPRHPWRRTTIFSLILCLVLSLALLVSLRSELAFAAKSGPPTALGALANWRSEGQPSNLWVQADGELADHGGISYRRPLDTDSFRLVPIKGNPHVWVQVRVPAGFEDEHFVAPTSFVGRLIETNHLGVRYSALTEAVTDAGWPKNHMPADARILDDGESPKAIRWVVALAAVLFGFAAFCVLALTFVLRPARVR